MRNLKTLLAAALVAAIPAVAQAQWYMGADAGAHWQDDFASTVGGTNYKVEMGTGWLVQGQAGYAFGPWKLEGEVSYRSAGVDKAGGASGSGDISALGLMANGIYEFMPSSKWHPFVGIGIGTAHVDAGTVKKGGVAQFKGDDWAFAYQGFAGVGYDITDNWSLKGQYRYFATTEVEGTSSLTGAKVADDYRDHAVLLGFTYKFKAAPAPAPMPAPVAAPAPAPAPKAAPAVARNFIVFFDFDKAAITTEADKIIAQAATAAKSTGAARIDLTGHTDLAGSSKYNDGLSQRRAEAVKAKLVALGVPASQIVTVAKGKSSPMVATPDGVREPQNRRVEIVLP